MQCFNFGNLHSQKRGGQCLGYGKFLGRKNLVLPKRQALNFIHHFLPELKIACYYLSFFIQCYVAYIKHCCPRM